MEPVNLPYQPLFQAINALSPINAKEWQALLAIAKEEKFQTGTALFHAGDTLSLVRFVVTGIACHYYIKPDGNRMNKSFLSCSDVASSLSSLHTQTPSRFGCDALTDVTCLSLHYRHLQTLSASSNAWRTVLERLLVRLALRKEKREADLLLLSPTDAYLQFKEAHPNLDAIIPNYHIAAYLGISEVSLSRIRSRLGLQKPYRKHPPN
ncbi:Crp/Fnr family transcriptional regulator [Thaumasiovibrio subtropicus]|uniref:Crp/Fnr family transcriptional regulator n=1 Tax=Thaumasiovibrio subtropicus TaxID=1891207 RepID=UPI000B35AC21|nr:Crp/Fnr family transcriptional regulator [Thaumasiovibrio subtropicus]